MSDATVRTVETKDLPDSVRGLPKDFDPLAGGLLMSHQIAWIEDRADLKLAEKGRRTGITFAEALDDTITAATSREGGGENIIYIGDTKQKGLEFIGYVAHFARVVSKELAQIEEFLFEDEKPDGDSRHITSYRVRFASGFSVVALSSRPESVRGLQGIVVIDEAAFHLKIAEMIRACNALLIWGGKIRIISTHNGALNAFSDLINDVRAGDPPYSLHHITFDDAVANGLYERVCLIRGWTPSKAGKAKWYNKILNSYGSDKEGRDEELFCIPREGEGLYFPLSILENCARPGIPVIRWEQPAEFAALPDHIRQAEAKAWCEANLKEPLARLDQNLRSFFGEDFARSGDLTVFWLLQLAADMKRVTPFLVELRNIPYREQELILKYIVDRLPNFMAGAMDARGNGGYLAERASQKYGENRIETVQLSTEWYRENMPPYKAALEDDDFVIPKHADVIADHRTVVMANGVAKVPDNAHTKGTDGKKRHGDSAIAGVLAHYASRMDVMEFGYMPAPKHRARVDDRPVDDDDGGSERYGERFGNMRGAW